MKSWIVLALAVWALPTAAWAAAEVDWQRWTTRMDKAQRSLNYDATLVIDQGKDWDVIELSQRIGPAGPEQQAVTLNGERRRFVRTAQGVSTLGPEGNHSLAKAPDLVSGLRIEQWSAAYEVHFDGKTRIAGRAAVAISLKPETDDRYGLRLWLDVDTGLPLRSDRVASDGSIVERRMVTRLVVLGFAGSAPPLPRSVPMDSVNWQLPEGFSLMSGAMAVPGIEGGRQWVLSDGVAWVSIYRFPVIAGQTVPPRGWRRGAIGQVSMTTGSEWLYVLGDLPTPTLERLGEAALRAQAQ